MALDGEVVLRLRICLGSECRAVFFLCARCDRGQRYCSGTCRERARLRQRRSANRRHQQSAEGRLDHRDRQRAYRERRRQPNISAGVTDQGSLLIAGPTSSLHGKAPRPRDMQVPADLSDPKLTHTRWLRCRLCGRMGRFVDPFPPLWRRR
jgi:hypothetical protein